MVYHGSGGFYGDEELCLSLGVVLCVCNDSIFLHVNRFSFRRVQYFVLTLLQLVFMNIFIV